MCDVEIVDSAFMRSCIVDTERPRLFFSGDDSTEREVHVDTLCNFMDCVYTKSGNQVECEKDDRLLNGDQHDRRIESK